MKKLFALLLSIFIALSISASALAVTQRATNRINITINPDRMATVGTPVSMERDETFTINCTYSPRTADVDFGIITPQNMFAAVKGENGNCYQIIRVTETGNYYFAIRNNTSEPVEVLGYVYY